MVRKLQKEKGIINTDTAIKLEYTDHIIELSMSYYTGQGPRGKESGKMGHFVIKEPDSQIQLHFFPLI